MSSANRAARAIDDGDVAALRTLLDDHPELLEARLEGGQGLVGRAAVALTNHQSIPLRPGTPEQAATLDLLLERGADPDQADDEGWTALHSAAMSGHVELARTLLNAGASLRSFAWDNPDATPACWAMFYAHAETAELFAARELVPDGLRSAAALGRSVRAWVDDDGELLDGATAGRGFYRPLLAFPEWDPPLDRQTTLDEALTWASRNGRIGAMEELVELGADLASNAYRGTALLWAAYSGRLEAIRWLVENGADPSQRHDFGGAGHGKGATALHLAAQFGALDTVRLLLELGADHTLEDEAFGGTPAGWAAHSGATEVATLLEQWRS
ncbi:MAG: ankyrin repeat domain-containing protein [Acidobacteriota bacterium]